MKAFRAIIGLTLRNALRSHVFQLLLVLLLLCICIIPASIGGGTAQDFIRVSLLYSIWSIIMILALSSLWLGCFIMAQDIDNYQLHMVVSKPVSRVVVWIGKWVGINIINIVLLLISLAVVYGIIFYRYKIDDRFTPAERERIKAEVLVGRRVFWPKHPNYAEMARQELRSHIQKSKAVLTSEEQEKLYQELLQRAVASSSEVPVQKSKVWEFENIPSEMGQPLFLRYRSYVGKVSSEDQRQTRLWWHVLVPTAGRSTSTGEQVAASMFAQPLTMGPQQLFSGSFDEKIIPAAWNVVTPDNKVRVFVTNYDIYGVTHFYQPADGPKLLVKICGFEMNFLRASLVMILQLALLSALACAFGGFLTMPTAVFMVVSYLLYGAFSSLLTDQEFFVSTAWDHLGQSLAKLLLMVVIPLQAFDVTDLLATGELIEYSLIWKLFLQYFVFRGVPFFLFGIWLYRRRELGLAVRK